MFDRVPPTGRLTALALLALTVACSTKPGPARSIRAHTTIHADIAHAEPAIKAEHYCVNCHGKNLMGGANFEPSCYQCHGKNWLDSAFSDAVAPPDHTIVNQTQPDFPFHHKPGQFTPMENCTSCHGADLSGSTVNGATIPGCNLCHDSLWLTRTPPPGQA